MALGEAIALIVFAVTHILVSLGRLRA